jgi:oligoribonuclease
MKKWVWLDLEMTGLDVNKEVIIEVAAIITDFDLNELGDYHSVVKQPQEYIDAMDDWNVEHHTASGLVAKIPTGKPPHQVENELCTLIDHHFKTERAIIAGNSITQDRIFIKKYFLELEARLHYRMLDVTAWKLIMTDKLGIEYGKRNSHRALDDIRESIEELKYYLKYITPNKEI